MYVRKDYGLSYTSPPLTMKNITLLLVTLLLSLQATGNAQEANPPFGEGVGPISSGTEFYVSFPANWYSERYASSTTLYISSSVETSVRVTVDTIDLTLTTTPGSIDTIEIPAELAQLFARHDTNDIPDDNTYSNAAIRVVADDPILLYGMNRNLITSEGLLVLPVSALGREYVVAGWPTTADTSSTLPSQFVVTAPFNNTRIAVVFSAETPSHAKGESVRIALNEGDVFSAMSTVDGEDLSGTTILTNKPVAVTVGQSCSYLPAQRFAPCDHTVEMMTPVEAWGRHYLSLPFQDRSKGDTYRIFAAEGKTEVRVNDSVITTLSKSSLDSGNAWFEYRQDSRVAMTFSADKPIMVLQYNNAPGYDQSTSLDPFTMTLIPTEQFMTDVVIVTPDNDFQTNYLNVIGDSATFSEIEMRMAGESQWRAVNDHLAIRGRRFFESAGGHPAMQGVVVPLQPGVYQLRAPKPFGTYLYGGGSFDSYGYPGALRARHIESSDTNAPDIAGTLNQENNETSGTVVDAGDSASGISTIRLRSSSSNVRLVIDRFIPGNAKSAFFTLQPLDVTQDGTARIIATDMAGNSSLKVFEWSGFPAVDTTAPAGTFALDSCSGRINGTILDNSFPGEPSSKLVSITLDESSVNYRLSNVEFRPDIDTVATLSLRPIDSTLEGNAVIVAVDGAGNRMERPITWNGPYLHAFLDTIDLGTIDSGADISHTFRMRNLGHHAVTITDVRAYFGIAGDSSFGRISTTFDPRDRQLRPGEAVELMLHLDASRRGTISGSIRLDFDCGPPFYFHIVGRVDSDSDVNEEYGTTPDHLDLHSR